MTDFETRLAEALSSGAERAPDADGLAQGARSRARRRRRAGYVAIAAAVVVALAIPLGVLAVRGDDGGGSGRPPTADDPAGPVQVAWQTFEHEGVLVDVPEHWEESGDSGCRIGVGEAGVCGDRGQRLTFYAAALFDPVTRPGQVLRVDDGWAGYVYAGDWAVYVDAAELETARRILGTAREEGQKAPDLSAGFRTESYGGLAIDVPADWDEGALSAWCVDKKVPGRVELPETRAPLIHCSPRTGYGIRFGKGASSGDTEFRERTGPEFPEGSWAGVAIAPDETGAPVGYVQVVAPTQGLAELIGGSLRAE